VLGGGIRSLEVADRLIAEGLADYLTFSRPLIREPDLANRWKSGDGSLPAVFPAIYVIGG